MPYGRKRALEIATTLALEPEMMLLDEPMAGMGHGDIDKIAALIKRVSANRTIPDGRAQSERRRQSLGHDHRSDARGRCWPRGDYATVSKNKDVQQAYMGVGDA